MANGEYQVSMAINRIVDNAGSETMTFHVDSPNSKAAKSILQHILNTPACSTNNHVSIMQSIGKGLNFDFNIDVARGSLGSVLVYNAALINGQFFLSASTTWSSR